MTAVIAVAGRCANTPGRGSNLVRGRNVPKYTCRHCGDEFLSPRISRPPKFCSLACKSGAAGVVISCAVCGTEFKVPPSVAAGRRYCSATCRWEVECPARSCAVGYANCAWCGTLFTHRAKGRSVYCCRDCELAGRRRTRNARYGFTGETVDRECETCGKLSVLYASKVSRHDKGRFCSKRCLGVAMRSSWCYGAGAGPSKVATAAIALWREANPGVVAIEEMRVGVWSIDLALPDLMVAVELDGVYWHSLPESVDRDKRKDAHLSGLGWRVVRVPIHARDTPSHLALRMVEHLERQ